MEDMFSGNWIFKELVMMLGIVYVVIILMLVFKFISKKCDKYWYGCVLMNEMMFLLFLNLGYLLLKCIIDNIMYKFMVDLI